MSLGLVVGEGSIAEGWGKLPFDQRLLDLGVHRAVALHLFEAGQVTLAQAAKLAGVSLEELMELLGEAGIPAVDYPPEELEAELEAAP